MLFSQFHATGLFLYLLEILEKQTFSLENQTFSDVFRRYRKRSVTSNGSNGTKVTISGTFKK